MSGDVQPRKRKDKKRKKEESTEQLPPQFQTPSAPPASEDINIHVHKDEGTGGGICAKIVFFFLFSALTVLIGLIITEHRGLTDLDTVDTESRFSQIFEGWIDNSVGHDDHDDHLEHSLEHDEDDHDDHGDESHEVSEGDEHDHEEEEEEVSEEKSQTNEEEDATEEDEEKETAEESALESEEEAEQEDDDEEDESATKYDEDDDEEQEPSDEQEEQEQSEEQELSEEQEASEEQEVSEEQVVSEEAAEDDEEDAVDSKEPAESQEEQEAADDDDDKPEESTENDVEDQAHDDDDETPDDEEGKDDENQENSRMAVKIGVGVALLVVAHVVLVRKWKTASTQETPTETQEPIPDLTRRNTIVVPPSFQEVRQDIDDAGDEDEEDEDEEEIEEVESEDDRAGQKSIKTKYQELRSTYSRSLTPDSETERRGKPAATEEYEEYDDEGEEVEEEENDDDEDVEEEDEAEEEEEEEDDEEEDYEKDQELLKRLEAKYGKIAGVQQTEPQEEFDEQFSSWKRVNVLPDNEPEESDSDRQSDDVDTYEYENITNKDDWKIKEKLDEAQKASQNE